MISRKTDDLPSNFPLSIAKMISDQFYISTAEVDYQTDIWNVMETTRLVKVPELAHQPSMWPIWYKMDWIFRPHKTRNKSEFFYITKLIQFSPDCQVYNNYMGSLAKDEMVKYLPDFDYRKGPNLNDLKN